MGLIKVVCGIIYQDNEIFICRRRPEKSLGGFWEFPGGKVEKGEECEISKKSIELMERIVLPLLSIQKDALQRVADKDDK